MRKGGGWARRDLGEWRMGERKVKEVNGRRVGDRGEERERG